MRRISAACFALLVVFAGASKVMAQQTIYMAVDSIKGDQAAPHDGEFKLNSFSYSSTSPSTALATATGLSAGRATFGPVTVSMRFNPATIGSFQRMLAMGQRIPSLEIRMYNSRGLYAKTVFEMVMVTNLKTEGSDEVNQEIQFTYGRVKWFADAGSVDTKAPATSPIMCWDITRNARC